MSNKNNEHAGYPQLKPAEESKINGVAVIDLEIEEDMECFILNDYLEKIAWDMCRVAAHRITPIILKDETPKQ